jgi:NAD(P)H dehydrogenase (quinone)
MRIGVTGANGNIGREILQRLARQSDDLVAVARRPLEAWDVPGVATPRTALADYFDRQALAKACQGVDTLVMISSEGPAAVTLMHHRNIIEAAAIAGVENLILLSSLGASIDSPFCYSVTNALTEQLAHDSAMSLTVVRTSLFMEFFLAFPAAANAAGEMRIPAGDGRVSLVGRSDVARSLAVLAVSPTCATHNITGSESFDMSNFADRCGRAFNKSIKYVDVSPAQYRIEAARAAVDPWWAYAYSTMFDAIRDQAFAEVSSELLDLTAQRAATLSETLGIDS